VGVKTSARLTGLQVGHRLRQCDILLLRRAADELDAYQEAAESASTRLWEERRELIAARVRLSVLREAIRMGLAEVGDDD